ncbi:MAG: MotA/TolQ/ExbB proton channel family protein [Opitutales bacterium]
MNKTPMELFVAGGVVMWPMILLSFVALTVVIERVIFAIIEKRRRKPEVARTIINLVEEGDTEGAIAAGKTGESDYLARVMVAALENKDGSMSDAFGRAASAELARFSQGLSVLDTTITAAPLLGLLGTVTGMMGAFGKVTGDLSAPVAITGGIAEALVATACGLLVAVTCLIPYSYLNSMLEDARRSIEEAGMSLEMALSKAGRTDAVARDADAL